MMAGLFAIFSFALISIYYKKRELTFMLYFVGIILCALMLWYHATSILQINL